MDNLYTASNFVSTVCYYFIPFLLIVFKIWDTERLHAEDFKKDLDTLLTKNKVGLLTERDKLIFRETYSNDRLEISEVCLIWISFSVFVLMCGTGKIENWFPFGSVEFWAWIHCASALSSLWFIAILVKFRCKVFDAI